MMKALLWIFAVVCSTTAYAGQVTVPNTFTAGTKAKASDVNANFTALEQAVNDNNARITQNTTDTYSNTTAIGTLNGQVAGNSSAIQTNAAAILGNAGNISNNATNITTNTNAINANSSAITALQQSVPTTYQVVDAYGTVLGDLLGRTSTEIFFVSSTGYSSFIQPLTKFGALTASSGGSLFNFQSAQALTSDYVTDAYTSVDCTGAVSTFNVVTQHPAGSVFDVVTYDPYGTVTFSQRSYIPIVVNPITLTGSRYVLTDPYVDPVTGVFVPSGYICRAFSISGFQPLPNDPAVTGVPNTIGFPVSIQKK